MELIIKPTGHCNFNCTFCSASEIDIAHSKKVPDKLKEVISILKPQSIIITGGEPLLVPPDYYFELYEIARCPISLSTNLKDFYLNPDKWKALFNNNNFGINTSFQYGEARRWDKNTPYTEAQFIKVTELFKAVTGKSLSFIAVIDYDNEARFLDHVFLAKRLSTKVKLNGVMRVGRQGHAYPYYKMMKGYSEIIRLGLEEYEINCSERRTGRCDKNIEFLCDTAIRACYLDSHNELHYGVCDDRLSLGDEIPYEKTCPEIKPIQPSVTDLINKDCLYCELYRLCNGCKVRRNEAKLFPEHCSEMLQLKEQLIKDDWYL
jgi:MoaA/NifB/PqqE/SkfB family radical SAM enzyme